ncbi:cellulose biosynthesis cyclic di-GMP-binding regulatory protein BcsB [Lysinibacillus sp. FSL K6-0232]|uniref:cellulose biosynthesis cyclic di-GMP-binding regulatory protein BcsB n=1 Tax=unclassified Lysinibacillus TaxID=2636778 RepID=UPI0030F5216A
MKAKFYLLLVVIGFLCFTHDATAATITVDQQTIVIKGNQYQKKPLLSQPIELQGPSSSRDFYYSLSEDVQVHNQQVTFHIQHSELLIAPSSFTVKVDDVALKTVPLTADLRKQTVTVNLPAEALVKGTHKITASFYGILKEGICVPPGNVGNWLRIDILSSISAFAEDGQAALLSSYPSAFLGYEGYTTTLILPKEASTATLNSGYQLAAYLSEHGQTDVHIQREDAVQKVTGPVIVVGAKHEFRSALWQNILADVDTAKGTMTLAMHKLQNTNEQQQVPLFIITATNAEAISERLLFLTEAKLFEQLVGQTLTIKDLPKVESPSATTIPFKQFGFEDQTLSSQTTITPHYYVSLPQLEANQEAVMHLLLKKSATMPSSKEDDDRKLELIVYINNVPHAVDLRKLEQTAMDIYEVAIPIQTNVLNKQSITDMQFEVTGFQLEEPCETTNERYWLYIDSDSSLSMTKDAEELSFTLRDFPNAFHDNVLMVVPDNEPINDMEMGALYKALMINGKVAQITLIKDKDVTEADLQKHAVIFIGNMDELAWLAKNAEAIPYTAQQLIQQGFLPEAMAKYAYITKSFWQTKQPLLWIHASNATSADNDFYAHLKETDTKAAAAIETKEGQFVVAVAEQVNEPKTEAAQGIEISLLLIAEFVGLIIVIAVILYMILRKRKKNQLKE